MGRLLITGENTIEAYTHPVIYEKEEVDYEEMTGMWIDNETFECTVMSSIPWPVPVGNLCIIKPGEYDWSSVEEEILTVRIPYSLLKESTKYNFTFSYYATKGFYWKHEDSIYFKTYELTGNNKDDAEDICRSFVFVDVNNNGIINNKEYPIYSPEVIVAGEGRIITPYVNNYDSWIPQTISFTTPSDFNNLRRNHVELSFIGRGMKKLKLKGISLMSASGGIIESSTPKIDTETKEHATKITVNYNKFDMEFSYINPMNVINVTDLRDKLLSVAERYKIDVLKVNNRYTINMCNLGFDASVAYKKETEKK